MKIPHTLLSVSILVLAGAGGALLAFDNPKQDGPQPTKEHGLLKMDEGRWNAEVTMYGAPGSAPQKDKGIEENKVDFNGLWLMSNVQSEGGFKGAGVTGYDPAKKMFVSGWIDNMSTSLMTMEGSYDEKTKSFTYKGMAPDAATGKMASVRWTTSHPDANTRRGEGFQTGADGKEVKTMEILYTRAK